MTSNLENETFISTQGDIIHYIFCNLELEENICQTLHRAQSIIDISDLMEKRSKDTLIISFSFKSL